MHNEAVEKLRPPIFAYILLKKSRSCVKSGAVYFPKNISEHSPREKFIA
jgi:hypothetical protein